MANGSASIGSDLIETVNLQAHTPDANHPHSETQHGTQHDPSHSHEMLEIPAGQPVPSVDLIVHQDSMQGWNLEIQTTNFRFAPENLEQPSSPTEGHAHLYINGEKITRLYGNWYYLGSLEPGSHEVTVSLSTNGHEELAHNGQPIGDTEVIAVSAERF
ncbi:MAG: hypothetical protein HC899_00190 [Leptolyngbyaceae cyanobacterium SM1_4_3]|nr:hypothetical protein [Leptolyngbyaceae cyanobacterium SM1_4_3]NJN90441.1 hypothetical protein [Leptolyngbyaceae cyanobacterium SL_5_14]NJO66278.1 hypothetical protein [Leptolyngbyaceae cyanobacterium RM1_405_57]